MSARRRIEQTTTNVIASKSTGPDATLIQAVLAVAEAIVELKEEITELRVRGIPRL